MLLNKRNIKGLTLGVLLGWLIVTNDNLITTTTNAVEPVILAPYNEESLTISYQLKINEDNRKDKVRALLIKYNSPMIDQADTYVDAADQYGIDWRLLVSISGIESGFGKHTLPESYNPFGWGGGYLYFESWEDSIYSVSEVLGTKWRTWTGLRVEDMASTYCPPNHVVWTRVVSQYMNELENIDLQLAEEGQTSLASKNQ